MSNALRAEIELAIARAEKERDIIDARIMAYRDVLGTIEDLAASEPPPPVPMPTERQPRNPKRDLRGTMMKALVDKYGRDRQPVALATLCEGAGLLLGTEPLTLSQGTRSLDPLLRDGSVTRIGNDYAPTAALPREGLTAAAE